jgi:lipopolysaccharide transport system ATP-binding protein
MSKIAIRCEGLGKKYRIGKRERYQALRDKLAEAMYAPFRKVSAAFRRNGQQNAEHENTIWALKDVSFEIKHGEVVGVIGRNGAGKSTLLKILSRITEPTVGQIAIHGRVGSLLEVGTGFHPELTGRENIFLNGAILGMSQAEIKRKFDEIVAFAEVEKFLETSVKHYSSGMYMRLAFAVAAHLDSEILMVDEVLAVGDAQFQKRCLGKMHEVAQKDGRAVLFVSHSIPSVLGLCQHGMLLDKGELSFKGSIEEAVGLYIGGYAETVGEVKFPIGEKETFEIKFARISLKNPNGEVTSQFGAREEITFEIEFVAQQVLNNVEIVIRIYTMQGTPVFSSIRSPHIPGSIAPGKHIEQFKIPGLFLSPGAFFVYAACYRWNEKVMDEHHNCLRFEIEETGTHMAKYFGAPHGVILANFPWRSSNTKTYESASCEVRAVL